jgi:superfamily II RNA helicase
MVKVCQTNYPEEQNEIYRDHFEKYPFDLSSFQKFAIEAILEGNNVLVTAHTGSGKTLPAEFAIEHFVSKGKKVIYTSPIKALSNQKFYEFTNKYPHISFGILTGDIKTNPEADVLIVTAEILLNTLYNKKTRGGSSFIGFEMDFDNELACVVMDEVHYINDADRGRVWEESIMMLPLHVQLVMLSATIDAPEKFASWIECRGNQRESEESSTNPTQSKIVYLASTNHRVVPLTHYSFITTNNGIFKTIKDKELEKQIREATNVPLLIQSSKGEFNEPQFHKTSKMLSLFSNKNVIIKRQHVLNNACKYLVENSMLPALCFVLSRKQLEICAKEITVPLLEDDSKVGYIVRRECEQIIRRLPNYQEYLELPEYLHMVALLEKGIAIHHAGITPILREMVELLFGKGYIKLLFATETFSIGISFPIKTVMFTDCNKFDGTQSRTLYPHEYTQMAGRAGRRGIDEVGHVIHLNNLFKNVELTSYRNMMQGKPQKLVSKFKISYNLILNLISIGDNDFTKFARRSMIQEGIQKDLNQTETKMAELSSAINSMNLDSCLQCPLADIQEYIDLIGKVKTAQNKKRKEMEKRIEELKYTHRRIEMDKTVVELYNSRVKEMDILKKDHSLISEYLTNNVATVLKFLQDDGFVTNSVSPETSPDDSDVAFCLTTKGIIASQLREIHCLVFSTLLEDNVIQHMSSRQLIGLFSCFTNCTVSEELRTISPKCSDETTQSIIHLTRQLYETFNRREEENFINSGIDYNMHYDLIDYCMIWCDCTSALECKATIQSLEQNKQVFLGEFIKALLKINNISSEMEKIAESVGDVEFLSKLREIPLLTLKFIATNQSLYV